MNAQADIERRLSVIIPVRNGEETILECLESLTAQSRLPDEVVVVDNGSVDQTVSLVKQWAATHPGFPLHLVREEKKGPAAARNRGAREARSDLAAFLDADCIAEPTWLETIEKEFQRGHRAVGGTYRGYLPGHWMEKYVHATRISLLGKRTELTQMSLYGPFLVGANSAFEKRLFQEVGGYDERLKAAEDFELSMRLLHHGILPVYNPDIRVVHRSRTSLLARLRRSVLSGLAEVYVFKQYGKRESLLRIFPGHTLKIPNFFRFYLDLWCPPVFLILFGSLFFYWGKRGLILIFLSAFLFFLRFIWILEKGGERAKAGELVAIVSWWLIERLCLEAGRLYGTIRYGVFYL